MGEDHVHAVRLGPRRAGGDCEPMRAVDEHGAVTDVVHGPPPRRPPAAPVLRAVRLGEEHAAAVLSGAAHQEDRVVSRGRQVGAVDVAAQVQVQARRRRDPRAGSQRAGVDDRGFQRAPLEDEEEPAAVVHRHVRAEPRLVHRRPPPLAAAAAAVLAEEGRVAAGHHDAARGPVPREPVVGDARAALRARLVVAVAVHGLLLRERDGQVRQRRARAGEGVGEVARVPVAHVRGQHRPAARGRQEPTPGHRRHCPHVDVEHAHVGEGEDLVPMLRRERKARDGRRLLLLLVAAMLRAHLG